MAKKKLKKTSEVGFIPGIYNYCDRWCEKCDQQLHCMSFVLGQKMASKGVFQLSHEWGGDDENLWMRLKKVFELTYAALHELAEERGLDIEDIYTSENINDEFLIEDFIHRVDCDTDQEYVKNSDVIRACLIYQDLADKCVEKILIFADSGIKKKNNKMEDALEVVEWYLDLIQSKASRALAYFYCVSGEYRRKNWRKMFGAAKVALIAIDRSIESWKVIAKACPDECREIGHLLVVLEELRSDMEEYFPSARRFQRPGLDVVD